MKAVRYHEYGDPSVMRIEEVDRPVPVPGQVLVQVAATAFNELDATMRAGYLQQAFRIRLPHTPGFDVAGTVVALGDGVTGFTVGDAVIGFLPMTEDGAAADFVLAPAEVLTAAPTSIPLTEAAALPSPSLTAWQALFEHADLRSGQRVLVNGAGGGVGGFVVQFARQAGATVIATASGRSAGAVRDDGADQIVDYTTTKVTDAVSGQVDVVINLVRASEDDMVGLVGLVRDAGVLVTATTPAREDAARTVRTISMFVRSDAGQLATIVGKVNDGSLRVDVSATYPLSEIATVHELSAAGKTRGKVLLIPGG